MKYYTYTGADNKRLYIKTFDSDTNEYNNEVIYDYPFRFYYPHEDGKFLTLYNEPCTIVNCNSVKDFYCKTKRMNDTLLYGIPPLSTYVIDNFAHLANWDILQSLKSPLRIVFYDIETYSPNEFPDYKNPVDAITNISIVNKFNGDRFVWGFKDSNHPKHIKVSNERELLSRFIAYLKEVGIDVLSGFNNREFDTPYTVARMDRIGIDYNELSPYGKVEWKIEKTQYGPKDVVDVTGISELDYQRLVKKFYKKLPKYNLDTVAKAIIKRNKVKYTGSLVKLYDEDYERFVDYNMVDSELLYDIDQKVDYMTIVAKLAYDGLVNFSDYDASIRNWDNITHLQIMNQYQF